MSGNPQQRLEPARISFAEMAAANFPDLHRADLMGSRQEGDAISDTVAWAQKEILGYEPAISHTMRYLGGGLLIDQQETLMLRPLQDYVGCLVRVYHWPHYSLAQRNSLAVESLIRLGPYDWWASGAHGLEAVLGVDGLAEELHSEDRYNCSEGDCTIERLEMPWFMGARPCQVLPAEIDEYCLRAGWRITTWLLEE